MNTLLYILGLGILQHPSFWWILGMTVVVHAIILMICWTFWLSLTDGGSKVSHRNLKVLAGIVSILILYYIFCFLESGYRQAKSKEDSIKVDAVSTAGMWVIETDSNGNVYVYN